jgi:hypothetical protein
MIGFIGISITITTNYNSSQSMSVWDSLHSLLDYEWLSFLLWLTWFWFTNRPFTNQYGRMTAHTLKSKSKSKLCYDRRSAGQSVLEQSIHLGLTTRSLLLVWQLGSCSCGAPSLTRGRVCPLYMLLVLASTVFLGSESLRTWDHILLSHIWDFPFRRLLRLAGSRWRYSIPPPHEWTELTLL